jgi:hypothetical protein
VKEIKAQFNRSEVSCRQILDHECIEWMRSELNMNHLELGAFPGAQRTAGRVFTWLMRPWTQTLNPGPKPRHPKHRPWTQGRHYAVLLGAKAPNIIFGYFIFNKSKNIHKYL